MCVCVFYKHVYGKMKEQMKQQVPLKYCQYKIFCITDTEDVSALMSVIWAKELVFERMVDLVKPGVDVFVRSIN